MGSNEDQKQPECGINAHGDILVETTGRHGPDISSQRIDELDRAALDFAQELPLRFDPAVAVDLGAGLGAQTARFAALGLSVLMVDLVGRPELVEALNSQYGEGRVSVFTGDARRMPQRAMPEIIHLLYSQRMLHYLRFSDAVAALRGFGAHMPVESRLFISCACLESELSEGYPSAGHPIEERFAPLAPAIAQKHGVTEQLCLYSRSEFVLLASEAGFSPLKVWRSDFGTLKGVFVRE